MSEFSRTLQTASEADGISALLIRAADKATFTDRMRLKALAERYADYAAALRETVRIETSPQPEQPALL